MLERNFQMAGMRINPIQARRFWGLIAVCALILYAARGIGVRAVESSSAFDVKVPASAVWTDTKIKLNAGEKILVTASGSIRYGEGEESGPEGLVRSWRDLLRLPPVKDAGRGALIGRVGDFDEAVPFLIGARLEFEAPIAGRLFLGVNEQSGDTAEGSFAVRVEILATGTRSALPASTNSAVAEKSGASATFVMPPERRVAGFTAEILDQIPRRVSDKDGHPGDMLNFVILGGEERLKQAFENGGWVLVDRTKAGAVVHGLLSTLSKEEYVEMPMSELYLYGRSQDFGYAHADPYAVVATRHHLRLWRAPMEVGGETLWLGAATHDVGFETDQRNGGVTHKIDPDIDLEREYVARTLVASGIVAQWAHVTPNNALTKATTATGGNFHSDGRIVVLVVDETDARDAATNSRNAR